MYKKIFSLLRISQRFEIFLERRVFARESAVFAHASLVVQFFYIVLIFYAFRALTSLDWPRPVAHFDPLWPIFWADYLPYQAMLILVHAFLFGGALCAAHFARYPSARIVAFLGALFYVSFENSFNSTNPPFYSLLYVLFWFMFLPRVKETSEDTPPETRKRFLLIFWITQFTVLSTYTMSGFGKLYDAGYDIITQRGITVFSPYALAYYIADWIPRFDQTSLLGPFIIEHPLFGWLPMLITLYLLVFSVWIAFKPDLHRIWAFGLLMFHVMVYLTMSLAFSESLLVLLLLFYASPFQMPHTPWRSMLVGLPLFGWLFNRLIFISSRVSEKKVFRNIST